MSRDSDFCHIPVLFSESMAALKIRQDGVYIDCTAGGGGHSLGILRRLGPEGLLLSMDKDEEAIRHCRFLREKEERKDCWRIEKADFAFFADLLTDAGIERADGILADFGVSSSQLDTPRRGFSYSKDGPLDMRMDGSSPITAAAVINTYDESDLVRIFRRYGEEKYAGRIAGAIVGRRSTRPFLTTGELAETILSALPARARNEDQHPARRVFMATRIEVNQELASIDTLLKSAPEYLRDGGRMAVISFHSLEDRRVKEIFRELEVPCVCPRDFPVCVCGRTAKGQVITKRAITASEDEIERNGRARTARLRVFERREHV